MTSRAVIAAGHPLTAEAGARVLREGGNAVDAAVAAVLASAAAEPLLTGLGAGGYLLVAGPHVEPTVLDFFVAAPGRESRHGDRVPLEAVDVDFGDAVQVFNVGPASCGVPGVPAGMATALEHEHFAVEIALTREDVVHGPPDGRRRRRRPAGRRHLVELVDRVRFEQPAQLAALLPGGLEEPFAARDLAAALGVTLLRAQHCAYVLRALEVIAIAGKRGNALLYKTGRR